MVAGSYVSVAGSYVSIDRIGCCPPPSNYCRKLKWRWIVALLRSSSCPMPAISAVA